MFGVCCPAVLKYTSSDARHVYNQGSRWTTREDGGSICYLVCRLWGSDMRDLYLPVMTSSHVNSLPAPFEGKTTITSGFPSQRHSDANLWWLFVVNLGKLCDVRHQNARVMLLYCVPVVVRTSKMLHEIMLETSDDCVTQAFGCSSPVTLTGVYVIGKHKHFDCDYFIHF